MYTVHCRKIVTLLLISIVAYAGAQNLPQYDSRLLHFGFSLNATHSSFQLNTSSEFYTGTDPDTLMNIRQEPVIGFGLGPVVEMRLSKQFTLRSLGPQISFAQRNLYYDFKHKSLTKKAEIESVYLHFPIHVKYRSERHWNSAFYVVGGFCYTFDLTSEIDVPRNFNNPVVALHKNMYSYEVGFGFDLYLPYFKLSPELKFSRSMNNMLVEDEFIFTRSISSIFPRTFTFSFHFEG